MPELWETAAEKEKATTVAAKEKAGKAPANEKTARAEAGPNRAAVKAPDDGYDGYYNDVLPIDSSELPEQMDPALMKQIIILLAGAAAIIALAIILMTLL